MQIVRPVLFQPFTTFIVAVPVAGTPIVPFSNKSDLIDSFVISLDATAANNVFIGDQGVTVGSGIEIIAGGGPVNFAIRNQVQQYDTQIPLLDMATAVICQQQTGFPIPFIVWDLSQIY